MHEVICHGLRSEKLTFDDLTENRKRHMKDYLVDYISKEKDYLKKDVYGHLYKEKGKKVRMQTFWIKVWIGLEIWTEEVVLCFGYKISQLYLVLM